MFLDDVNRLGAMHLHLAKTEEIARLLLEAGADVDSRDRWGRTPLHSAKTGKIARVLLKAGATVDAHDKWKYTPLCTARNAEIMLILLEAGANPHVCDVLGSTPIESNSLVRKTYERYKRDKIMTLVVWHLSTALTTDVLKLLNRFLK